MQLKDLSPEIQAFIKQNFPNATPAMVQQVLDIAAEDGIVTEEELMQLAQELIKEKNSFNAKSQALKKIGGKE